jgi:hypothetical protein
MAPTAVCEAGGRGRMVLEQGRLRRSRQSQFVMGKPSPKCLAAGHVHGSGRHGYDEAHKLTLDKQLTHTVRPKLNHAGELKLYAQEPRFTFLDREFLRSLDITVLDPPQAEELVDESTFTFIPCIEWLLELPFMLVAVKSPLYVSSSMHWIADEAERFRNRLATDVKSDSPVLKQCDDAMAAAKAIVDTHHESNMPETDFADGHSLGLTIYTLKHRDED